MILYYIPFKNFTKELLSEIKSADEFGPGFVSSESVEAIWAQDIFYDLRELKIDSIGDAAKKLKNIHSHWINMSFEFHRRSYLIQEKLNFYKVLKLDFKKEIKKNIFGFWFLKDPNTILYSKNNRHLLPMGVVEFLEDKENSPSRAYLKLWELMTVHKIIPDKKSICLDMGASPGGWTWVLSKVCDSVISVDKALLDPKIQSLKNVEFIKKDAFRLDPIDISKVDWFFCDIICNPEDLLELIEKWKNHAKNFVCTIKFKGKTDFEIIKKFSTYKGSKIWHLYNNKHELTWYWKAP